MDTEIGPDASDSSRSAEPAADSTQFAAVEPIPPTASGAVPPPLPTNPPQPPHQPPNQPPIEPSNQLPNQPPIEPPSQPPIEPLSQPPHQPPIEPPSQPPHQPPIEPSNQMPNQPPIEPPSQPSNQLPNQLPTQPQTQPPGLPPYPSQAWPAPPSGQQPPNPYAYGPGYPPYGSPYSYAPYGRPQPPTGTNGLAIAALVLGICGFFVVTPIIGLIFGIVSLAAVRRTGQKGKGLAISGIVLSSAWIALLGTLFTVAAINAPDPAQRSADGTVVSPGTVPVFGLHPKDCFTLPAGAVGSNNNTRTLNVVPCTKAHDSEAFGSFSAAESTFPGVDSLRDESVAQCGRQLGSFVPDQVSLPAGTQLQFIYPNQQAWDAGERRVTCFLQFRTATMTHSVYRDPSTYSADQLRFLNAVSPLSMAIGQLVATPDSADISVLQQHANDIASATQTEVSALSGTPWPASVQPAMDALIANHTNAAAVWGQVAGTTDVTAFLDQARRAETAFDARDMIAVRTALGLTTPTQGASGGTGEASA